jgi:iron complex outermembrane receptor protein
MPARNVTALAFFATLTGLSAGLIPPGASAIEEIIVTTQKREQSLQDVPLAVSAFDEQFLEQANVVDFRDLVALTPGFNGNTDDGFIDALAIRGISTNDFGIGGDPSVAIFVDGVHEGRNGGVVTTFLDIERAEVVRGPQNTLFGRNAIGGAISVVTHKPEEAFSGKLSAAVEEYDHYELDGTVNVPLTDNLFFRASLAHSEEDGYLDNLAGGRDLGEHESDAGQAALRWKGEAVDATLTGFFENRDGDPSVYWSTFPLAADGSLDPAGARLPDDKVSTDVGALDQGRDESDIFKLTLNVDVEIGGGYSVTSITGYKSYDFNYLEDYDATGVPVNNYQQDQEVDYVSQEIRLNSPGNGKVVWFVGGSIYDEDIDATFNNIYSEDDLCRALGVTEAADIGAPVSGCDDPDFEAYWEDDIDPADLVANKAERNVNEGDYWGWALYADATWSVTDRLDLIFGARYTYDEKEFRTAVFDSGGALGNNFVWEFHTGGRFIADEDDWSDFTPRVAFNYTLSDQWSFYGNISTGYKSGGYSTFGLVVPDADGDGEIDVDDDGLAAPGTVIKKFDSEDVVSFEVGAKARLLDDTLQANLSLYNYQYDDLQLLYFVNGSQLTDNVAEASGTGAELELRWEPNDRWELLASLAYTDTEIDSVDQSFLDDGGCDACTGNELWFNPDWSASEVITYHIPLAGSAEIYLSAEHHYQDDMFAGPDNLALAVTPSWNEFNFRIGFDSGERWRAVAYVQNAFDEEYFERGWENADVENLGGYGLVNTLVWPSKPRTFGVRGEYRF